jgi:hypothetical protein
MEILAYIVNWKPLIPDMRGKDTSKWAEAILAERLVLIHLFENRL